MNVEKPYRPDTVVDHRTPTERRDGVKPNQALAVRARGSGGRRGWVGDVVRVMVGLAWLMSAISHLVSAISG